MAADFSNRDTIVAPATAAGFGAIAIVRLSGSQTRLLLGTCFKAMTDSSTVNNFSHHRLVLGDFTAPGENEPIDQVMAVFMPAPHSYTGEDVAEIHCHGSPAVVAQIIAALCRAGARPAQPGEFTRRAFENGRIDLAQAEAVCDLVRSATAAASRLALRQLTGRLSRHLNGLRQTLVDVAAEIEARLDFPEEEIEPANRQAIEDVLRRAECALDDLVRQGRRGRLFREGARIVLVGRPNVGKSSLLNALVGRERAIVSPHPGTTRDTIECTLDLAGIAATLVDTAGWRAGYDEIERMGVERTEGEVAVADLLVWVVDGSDPLNDEDWAIAERVAPLGSIVACNKSDLPTAICGATIQSFGFEADRICRVSAISREGIRELEGRMIALLLGGQEAQGGETALVSNARHLALLERARQAVGDALRAFAAALSGDLVMVDVRLALGALDGILGRRFDDEVLDAIFARFCIGK
jgi:tRNA modification GTPase